MRIAVLLLLLLLFVFVLARPPLAAAINVTVVSQSVTGIRAAIVRLDPPPTARDLKSVNKSFTTLAGISLASQGNLTLSVDDPGPLLLVVHAGSVDYSTWLKPSGADLTVDVSQKTEGIHVPLPPAFVGTATSVNLYHPVVAVNATSGVVSVSLASSSRTIRREDDESPYITAGEHAMAWARQKAVDGGPPTAWLSLSTVEKLRPLFLSTVEPYMPGSGDANLDGQVNIADAVGALRLTVGLDDGSGWSGFTADTVAPAGVTVADAVSILRLAVGL